MMDFYFLLKNSDLKTYDERCSNVYFLFQKQKRFFFEDYLSLEGKVKDPKGYKMIDILHNLL